MAEKYTPRSRRSGSPGSWSLALVTLLAITPLACGGSDGAHDNGGSGGNLDATTNGDAAGGGGGDDSGGNSGDDATTGQGDDAGGGGGGDDGSSSGGDDGGSKGALDGGVDAADADLFLLDGALGGDGCVPNLCADLGPNACGIIDNCGQSIECGDAGGACPKNQTCNTDIHQCVSTNAACAQQGAQCGVITDTCGVVVACPSCVAPEICNATTHQCEACVPPTQADCAGKCVATLTGCGTTITCSTPVTCGAAKCDTLTGECCTPLTCASPGVCQPAGSVPVSDGCGGTLTGCKACPVVAPPTVCEGKCGTVKNTCGDSINCGTSNCNLDGGHGQQCVNNACTCVSPCTNGVCGTHNDSCGVPTSCGCTTSNGGTTCGAAGKCCTPTTLSCGEDDCGVKTDPCTGDTLDCGAQNNHCQNNGEDGGDGKTTCSDNTCCTPATACPANYCSGKWQDPCSKVMFDCSGSCGSQVCGTSGTCCTPATCGADDCGIKSDGCGGTIDCTGNTCSADGTKTHCGGNGECCTPGTCGPDDCGIKSDGCLGTIDCTGNTCGSDGTKTHCGTNGECCTPATACPAGLCGTWVDPCSQRSFPCATACNGGDPCVDNKCCVPTSCANVKSCKPISPGCGLPAVTCVECSSGSECLSDGSCCAPAPCPQGFTGSFEDGCGDTVYCESH